MKEYITKSKKSPEILKLINEALDILESVGVPFEKKRERSLETMAMSFLAVAGVTEKWKDAKGQNDDRHLTSKQIVHFINEHYEDKISPGTYDDVKRSYLKLLTLSDLVLNSANNPHAQPNDPTRGNTLAADFRNLVTFYNTPEWQIKLKLFNKNRPSLAEILERKRNLPKVEIKLPDGQKLQFSLGTHNQLLREIVEEFLPRFGNGCNVLYIGDATNRFLLRDDKKLLSLGFFELSRDVLPDVVAYDSNKNWLYLIEAVTSSGPMDEIRVLKLNKLLSECKAGLIFVTAFTSRQDFKKHILDIAWESEVWTADNPDHLVHFNGDKFLGPYKKESTDSK